MRHFCFDLSLRVPESSQLLRHFISALNSVLWLARPPTLLLCSVFCNCFFGEIGDFLCKFPRLVLNFFKLARMISKGCGKVVETDGIQDISNRQPGVKKSIDISQSYGISRIPILMKRHEEI